MGRTINRYPQTVNTNVGNDDKFFNHVNWKGICTYKNYPNLDQETFEDAKNVYIDDNGVLSSRPSFKQSGINSISYNIIDVKVFGNIEVVITHTTNDDTDIYNLYFFHSGKVWMYPYNSLPRLLYFNNYILIFSEKGVEYYAGDKPLDANIHIYKPIVNLITNGVKSTNEDFNILTNEYRDRYIYTNVDSINNAPYLGKRVTIRYNNNVRDVIFKYGIEKTIFLPKASVNGELAVSSIGNMISYSKIAETNSYNIYYSPDGKTFSKLPSSPSKIIGKPMISDDGTVAIIFLSDGPYVISLLNTGYEYFANWTNLLDVLNYTSTLPEIDTSDNFKCIGCNFVDFKNFVCIYGTNKLDTEHYDDYVIIHSVEGNVTTTILEAYDINGKVQICNYNIAVDISGNNFVYRLICYNSNITYLYISTNKKRTIAYKNPEMLNISYGSDDILCGSDGNFTLVVQINDTESKILGHTYDKLDGYFKVSMSVDISGISPIISSNGDVYTSTHYYTSASDYKTKFKFDDTYDTVKSKSQVYLKKDDILYSNYIGDDVVTVDVLNTSDEPNKILLYEYYCELNDIYCSKGDSLYISQYKVEDGKKLLYFPKIKIQKFNKKITNIHPISETQIAIFFEDEIWHTDITESGEYLYYKSKLQTGLRKGSDVVTSTDGKTVIFSSTRGLVYMSYQELIQSTEQTLTYLSDIISDIYDEYNKGFVKLCLHKHWLYCYNTVDKIFLILDMRNGSWWKWEHDYPILNILSIDDLYFIFNFIGTNCKKLDLSSTDYRDDSTKIDWYIVSQKLHFGTFNHYKTVKSIIINNVSTDEGDLETSYNLEIKNYRIEPSDRYLEAQNLLYKVNTLRTFVKRCNSRRVNEFQYTLSSDTDENGSEIQMPVKIHGINIKYSISGQVR